MANIVSVPEAVMLKKNWAEAARAAFPKLPVLTKERLKKMVKESETMPVIPIYGGASKNLPAPGDSVTKTVSARTSRARRRARKQQIEVSEAWMLNEVDDCAQREKIPWREALLRTRKRFPATAALSHETKRVGVTHVPAPDKARAVADMKAKLADDMADERADANYADEDW